MDAPTADELRTDPTVQAAFAVAWADSFVDDPTLRHEEGGYIYWEIATGRVLVRRTRPGLTDALDLSHPPHLNGCYLVATYHTHPNPAADGWRPQPSDDDWVEASGSGVPWFVVSEVGVFVAGPIRRVGGLSGPPGYPI